MQGRLQDEKIAVRIESPCGACARPIRIDVDQELRWDAPDADLRPLILEPSVDWSRFGEPSMQDALHLPPRGPATPSC